MLHHARDASDLTDLMRSACAKYDQDAANTLGALHTVRAMNTEIITETSTRSFA
jgi:hypothetical protein